MELTIKQKEGLEIALKRFNDQESHTIISGYAGSGKSTLVKFLIAALPNINPDKDVVYTSYTGKATEVLAKKGNKNTKTLHKLLYESYKLPDGNFSRKLVKSIDYKIVIVDEISMVPHTMLVALANFKVHVIGLGDPFQLPPIYKNEDNHLLDNPHIFLDEIMRQAAESEIIQLTMKIRAGEKILNFKGKEVQVISSSDLSEGMLEWADQVIVPTNKTRISLNNKMREMKGYGGAPCNGDKVICCKNYWDTQTVTEKSSLTNGSIGYIRDCYKNFVQFPGKAKVVETLVANIDCGDGEMFRSISMDREMIGTGISQLTPNEEYNMFKNKKFRFKIPKEFEYGYAITCHRAQGSEWDNVLVVEEGFPFNPEEHARWLYTACTRAAKRLVLVLKD